MLTLQSMTMVGEAVHLSYVVRHNVGQLATTLEADLQLKVNPHTGATTASLDLGELDAESLEAARARLAVWCERMAAALRAPVRQPTASLPVYEPVPFAPEQLSPFEHEAYEALVARFVRLGDASAMREVAAALPTARHPLVLVRGAIDHALAAGRSQLGRDADDEA